MDHAFIVAGGEITKAARNWLAENLDASKRNQIMFLDRNDILNLYVVTNLPLPAGALRSTADPWGSAPPFWVAGGGAVIVEMQRRLTRYAWLL